MDLVGNRRKRAPQAIVSNALKDVYSHDLQLYQLPPGHEIQLGEFEELALERVELFRILEQATQKGHKIYSNDWKECIYVDLIKHNLKKYYRLAKSPGEENPTEADLQARRADHISHFILRLAYCRSEHLRKWFLTRELEWFKLRFTGLNPKSIQKFLKINNFTYTPISEEEKREFHEELYESTSGTYVTNTIDFYKIKFTEVLTLVKGRRVFIRNSMAYIPSYELVTCVLGIFRTSLNKALVYANRKLPFMDDDRINFLISNLHHIYAGNNYTQSSDGAISLSDIDNYSRQHFPLCMRNIYDVLKRDHHLKHWGRLQFGLFLKGVGLSFEDAMTFWREEFTKRIDSGTFEKQYAYGVKHTYGKVGGMTNYTPHSCLKIINQSVGPGDSHGCPFKHWDPSILKAKLTEYGMRSDDIQEVVDTATKGHFQVACSKYFEYSHGQANRTVVNHPNQYVEESVGLTKEAKDKTQINIAKKSEAASSSTVPNDISIVVDDVNWDETM